MKAIAQPAKTYVFLLQTQPSTNTVVAQIVVESALFERQPVQVRSQRLVLNAPDHSVRIEGCSVHQERIHVIKVAT